MRRLEIYITNRQFLQLQPLPPFPLLRFCQTTLDIETARPLIKNAPSLIALRVYGVDLEIFGTIQCLTSLDLGRLSLKTFLDVLTTLPHLSHLGCELGAWDSERDSHDDKPIPRTFPQLASLDLKRSQKDAFAWLTLPGLLRLEICDGAEPPIFDIIVSFLTRSACTLDHLRICLDDNTEYSFDESQVTQLLKACYCLRTLDVRLDEITDPFLSSLKASPALLSGLEHLTISAWAVDIDYEGIVEILSRGRGSENDVKLKTFSLTIWVDDLAEAPRRTFPGYLAKYGLKRLLGGGLDFSILHEDHSHRKKWGLSA
ncbi:hypothetical protein C8R43DRAFT_1230635 [Mycena crocata]|nr:hypothetical protein C8R43DRAFT_1230635 [Mycena crocata]